MANEVFGRANLSNVGGVFLADNATVNFGSLPSSLVQQLNVQFAQMISRLYGVGDPNQYYVGGRVSGQMSLNRVIGPAGSSATFYNTFGNVCTSVGLTILLSLKAYNCAAGSTAGGLLGAAGLGALGGSGGGAYTIHGPVITQVSVGVAAQDMIIGENTNMMFADLEVT